MIVEERIAEALETLVETIDDEMRRIEHQLYRITLLLEDISDSLCTGEDDER